jgi:hypothetical protein
MRRNSICYNFCVFSLILLAPLQDGSCRSGKTETMRDQQNRVAAGNWGGPNVSMNVTNDGAQLRFSCARGSIEGPIALETEGRFSAPGTFTREPPGPTREDNPPKNQPATYSGSMRDQKMTLTITLTETKEEVGSFELEYGKTGRVFRCH